MSTGVSLRRLDAAIYNFGKREFYGINERRLILRDGDWEYEIRPIGERSIEFPPDLQSKQLRATHFVSLRKALNASFTPKEAEACLGELGRFLSFCHGHQVCVGFATGVDESGIKTFDEFGLGFVSPFQDGDGWLDRHQGKELPDLFASFLSKTRNSLWADTFRIANYWTSRGDTNLTGPDGGIILLQAALERIAWDLLTQEPQIRCSISEVELLGATVRLRKVLEFLGIPTSIPAGLTGLALFATQEGQLDGPKAFTKIRNELVHPKKRIQSTTDIPYYECYVLGKWYVELAFLRMLDFSGKYSNRTRLKRRVGETELVPWVSQ